MKYLLPFLFILFFSFAAYGQGDPYKCNYRIDIPVVPANGYLSYTITYLPPSDALSYPCLFFLRSYWNVNGTNNPTENFGPNLGPQRSGNMEFRDRVSGLLVVIPITQTSGCTYSLASSNANFSAAASGGTFDMHAYTSCLWTITPQVDWITINLNQNANGSGTVGYSVAANTGAARTGTINAQGQIFTVNQAAALPPPTPTPTPSPNPTPTPACTYALGTTSQSFTYMGGAGLIDVITQSGCAYTATNNDSFVTLLKSSGTGNGTIN
ncbi:MAG: BACON domain-containing protein, partial [Pyrinomonadaceae bacterium]